MPTSYLTKLRVIMYNQLSGPSVLCNTLDSHLSWWGSQYSRSSSNSKGPEKLVKSVGPGSTSAAGSPGLLGLLQTNCLLLKLRRASSSILLIPHSKGFKSLEGKYLTQFHFQTQLSTCKEKLLSPYPCSFPTMIEYL